MRKQMQLKHQLFLHSKAWLMVAILSMIVLSVYNLVVSWLLQKIIDIAAGNDSTSLGLTALVAAVTFVIFYDRIFYLPHCKAKIYSNSNGAVQGKRF